MSITMYTNIWYDSFMNKMHLWWIDEGVRKYEKFNYEHDYWVKVDHETGVKDMFGKNMERRVCDRKKDMPKMDYRDVAEGDLKEEVKFLHNFFKDKELTPSIDNLQVCYYDIEVAVGKVPYTVESIITVRPMDDESSSNMKKVSLGKFLEDNMSKTYEVWDTSKKEWIELSSSCYVENDEFPDADKAEYPINAIAAYFSIPNKLYLLVDKDFKYVHEYSIDIEGNRVPKTFGDLDMLKIRLYQETNVKIDEMIVHVISNETQLIEKFTSLIKSNKTDVITGWNIEEYDNVYVQNRLVNLGSSKTLSPINRVRISEKKDAVQIFGITVIDYMKLYRDKFTFVNQGYYSLDNISRIELNKSKLEYEGTFRQFYKNDWNGFCLYNCIDTLLVKAIDDKKGFLNLALMSSHKGKVPMEQIMGTLGGLTGLSLEIVHKQNMVLNNRQPGLEKVKFPGGVSWCIPGLYQYCVSFDITSMYPHFMVRDNIGIETVEVFDEGHEMQDIIRVDDTTNKRSYFFNPTDEVKVGRDENGKMSIINIKAVDLLETDMIIIGDDQKPNWNYKMAIHAEW